MHHFFEITTLNKTLLSPLNALRYAKNKIKNYWPPPTQILHTPIYICVYVYKNVIDYNLCIYIVNYQFFEQPPMGLKIKHSYDPVKEWTLIMALSYLASSSSTTTNKGSQ